jgi:membrane fusion protein, multidrug efflux system
MRKSIYKFISLLAACVLVACSTNRSKTVQPTAQATPSQTPTVTVATVQSLELNRQIRLPGELQPWQDTAIYAKVQGFIVSVNVDRGSMVKSGQLLARLRAPELDSQRGEAEARARAAESHRDESLARVSSIRAQKLEAEAKLTADESTYRRMKAASATPGTVAGNDIEIAQRAVEAGRARVQLWNENEKAAQAQAKALEENERASLEATRSAQNIEEYLRITAPFDGVITERNVHQGSLASPSGTPMLRLQQVSRLRLVVSVPEEEVSGIKSGTKIDFTVPAFPGETFTGIISRISQSLDSKTRTMPIELDVSKRFEEACAGDVPRSVVADAQAAPITLRRAGGCRHNHRTLIRHSHPGRHDRMGRCQTRRVNEFQRRRSDRGLRRSRAGRSDRRARNG